MIFHLKTFIENKRLPFVAFFFELQMTYSWLIVDDDIGSYKQLER